MSKQNVPIWQTNIFKASSLYNVDFFNHLSIGPLFPFIIYLYIYAAKVEWFFIIFVYFGRPTTLWYHCRLLNQHNYVVSVITRVCYFAKPKRTLFTLCTKNCLNWVKSCLQKFGGYLLSAATGLYCPSKLINRT